ncbi:MAG TPA: hypothetical protein RMG48_03380 [Myxococcales bacterium LLY-WYZ-16_1]|jgi:hypothetical protein|nr:hypothetical protein [Myxococcales bacterium LLY-WYZ-16_1]
MSGAPNPHPRRPCHTQRLVDGPVAAVDQCGCGTLTLHLGSFSLRMTDDVMDELIRVLSMARRRREGMDEEGPPPTVPQHLLRPHPR